MEELPEYRMAHHTEGDTFSAQTIGPCTLDGDDFPSALDAVRVHFRHVTSRRLGIAFSSDPGTGEQPITISNATTWVFTLDEVDYEAAAGLTAGEYAGDVEFTRADGVRKTYARLLLRVRKDGTADLT